MAPALMQRPMVVVKVKAEQSLRCESIVMLSRLKHRIESLAHRMSCIKAQSTSKRS